MGGGGSKNAKLTASEQAQKRLFTEWLNGQLKKHNLPYQIKNLEEDISKGVIPYYLLQELTGTKSNQNINKKAGKKPVKVTNLNTVVELLRQEGPVGSISVEDVADKKMAAVLEFVWAMVKKYHVQENLGTEDDSGILLLAWCKRVTDGYPNVQISNFTSSFKDGLAFCAIAHKHLAHSRGSDDSANEVVNFKSLSSANAKDNLELAFEAFKTHFAVAKVLTFQDFSDNNVDDKIVVYYISTLYKNLPKLPEAKKEDSNVSPVLEIESPESSSKIKDKKVAFVEDHVPENEAAVEDKVEANVADNSDVVVEKQEVEAQEKVEEKQEEEKQEEENNQEEELKKQQEEEAKQREEQEKKEAEEREKQEENARQAALKAAEAEKQRAQEEEQKRIQEENEKAEKERLQKEQTALEAEKAQQEELRKKKEAEEAAAAAAVAAEKLRLEKEKEAEAERQRLAIAEEKRKKEEEERKKEQLRLDREKEEQARLQRAKEEQARILKEKADRDREEQERIKRERESAQSNKDKAMQEATKRAMNAPGSEIDARRISTLIKVNEEDPNKIFETIECLGEGTSGTVFQARNKKTKEIVAVKLIKFEENDMTEIQKIQKEINIMKDCNHPNVVRYHGAYLDKETLWIAMEFCGTGSVENLLSDLEEPFTEEQIAYICRETLNGLQYLHSKKIIHRDIKGENILLNEKGEVKLADFGVSAQLLGDLQRRKSLVGTPYWMAPEVIEQSQYYVEADIWSLGITAIEMAEMKPPHAGMHPVRVFPLIPKSPPPTLKEPEAWSANFIDFVGKCLVKNPKERPNADQMLQHPFITSFAAKQSNSCMTEKIEQYFKFLDENGEEEEEEEEEN